MSGTVSKGLVGNVRVNMVKRYEELIDGEWTETRTIVKSLNKYLFENMAGNDTIRYFDDLGTDYPPYKGGCVRKPIEDNNGRIIGYYVLNTSPSGTSRYQAVFEIGTKGRIPLPWESQEEGQ